MLRFRFFKPSNLESREPVRAKNPPRRPFPPYGLCSRKPNQIWRANHVARWRRNASLVRLLVSKASGDARCRGFIPAHPASFAVPHSRLDSQSSWRPSPLPLSPCAPSSAARPSSRATTASPARRPRPSTRRASPFAPLTRCVSRCVSRGRPERGALRRHPRVARCRSPPRSRANESNESFPESRGEGKRRARRVPRSRSPGSRAFGKQNAFFERPIRVRDRGRVRTFPTRYRGETEREGELEMRRLTRFPEHFPHTSRILPPRMPPRLWPRLPPARRMTST